MQAWGVVCRVEVWRDLGVNLFRMFQSWQGPDRLPRSALGQPDFVKTLQVHHSSALVPKQ